MAVPLERIWRKADRGRVVPAAILKKRGFTSAALSRLVTRGQLSRVGRGLYSLPGQIPGEHAALVTVAQRAPGVLFCLLTALRFHNLTTQAPFEVWIAIPNKAHPPRLSWPKLRTVRFSGRAFTEGVDVHRVDGVNLRVTSVAKTVADCFKFRNKIGLDVALEALRESLRSKRTTSDDLWRAAKVCRVTRVMRPYMDSM